MGGSLFQGMNTLLNQAVGIAQPKQRATLMQLLQQVRQPPQPSLSRPAGFAGNIKAYQNYVQQGPQQTPFGRPMPALRYFNK